MDNSNDGAQEPRVLRARGGRTALTDIKATLSSAANRIVAATAGTRKRKVSESAVETTAEADTSVDGVDVIQNPISAAPATASAGTRSSSRSNSASKAAPGTDSASKASASSSSSASKSVTNSASKKLLPDTLPTSQPDAATLTTSMTQPLPAPTGPSSASKRAAAAKRQAVESASTGLPTAVPAPTVSAVPAAPSAVPQAVAPVHKVTRKYALRNRASDPAMCFEVLDDMYNVYYDLEVKYRVAPYMANQSDINFKMRAILVDWLVEVHSKFKLQPATLWLSITILDRYLACTPILRSKLQLVGVTSLFIACKFEELLPPEVRDCVYITDFAYDREEVLKMESAILQKLNYDIHTPTGYHFLSRYLHCIKASERTRMLASYYCERNMQEADMFTVLPHVFAASAVYSALKQQSTEYAGMPKMDACCEWSRALQEESGLSKADLLPTATWLIRHVNEETQTTSKRRLIAAKKKYSQEKFHSVALLPLPPL